MQELFVDTEAKLIELCCALQNSEIIALDTEFFREKTYYAQLCLLQLATEDLIACVDPLALADLSPLLDVLYQASVVKVMHSARQDLEIFYDLKGALPAPIHDTQIAATLLGFGDQLGYANLVKSMLSVVLDKSHSRTDWQKRPLDAAQLQYAMDDVRYLIPIYRLQQAMLLEKKRQHWLVSDFNQLTNIDVYAPPLETLWRRVRGVQHLKGVQLAVLQGLCRWRELLARQLNRPRRWLVSDEMLIELARKMPTDLGLLEKVRGYNNSLKKNAAAILTEIEIARALPVEKWPGDKRPLPLTADKEALLDMLMAIVRVCAQQNGVTPAVLATRKDLEAVIMGANNISVLSGWRYELAGKTIRGFLSGDMSIRLLGETITIEGV
ncbi:MAG: ribonuclease D [Gammaproteobacteria bacterium]|nr:ribonuclease D [Gammaproteobacteria bacterium]